MPPDVLEGKRAWMEITPDWRRAETRSTRTDADGRYGFREPGDHGLEGVAVVWASRTGYRAGCRVLDLSKPPNQAGAIQLEPCEDVRVRVVDGHGAGVGGAIVEQVGVALANSDAGATGPERRAAVLFARGTAMGPDGEGLLCSFPGEQCLRARAGKRISRPVILQPSTTELTLKLGDSFLIEGTVQLAAPAPHAVPPYLPRISVSAHHGHLWRELAASQIGGDGAFGPLELPLLPGQSYRLRAEAYGYLPRIQQFESPAPASTQRFDIVLDVAITQWCKVTDTEDEGLPEAWVEMSWAEEGEVRTVHGRNRGDGFIPVVMARPGTVNVRGLCPGYATVSAGPFEIPADPPLTIYIALPPAGVVSGRVLDAAGPVPDFSITWWRAEDPDLRQTRSFLDRPEGTFELDDVAEGETLFVAATPLSSGSDVRAVSVSVQAPAEIELRLPDSLRGHGRVFSRASGEPLPDALVQAYTMGAGSAVERFGAPAPVGADGAFELPFCRPGQNTILVTAPNHAHAILTASDVDGEVAFGRIELQAPLDLAVELHGPTPCANLSIRTLGPERRSGLRFEQRSPELASLVVEDLSPGYYEIVLEREGVALESIFLDFGQGMASTLRFLASGGGDLSIRVDNQADLDLAGARLLIDHRSIDGHKAQRYAFLEEDGVALVRALPPGPATVTLFPRDKPPSGSAEATVVAGARVEVVLQASNRSARIRVLDSGGSPVAGARVLLQPAFGSVSSVNDTTNAAGEALFRGVRSGAHIATVWHTSLGTLTNAPIEIPEAEEESLHELVLDAQAGFRLLVQDEEEPLGNVGTLLANRVGSVIVSQELPTASDGTVEYRLLAAGTYHVLLTRPDAWPVELDVEAREDVPVHQVSMRRLGDLELRALNPQGIPLEGVALDLVDLESGESVRSWLEHGRVSAAQGLQSDKHGKIEIQGLPRGAYSWSLPEQGIAGELTIAPGETAVVPLAIGG
jgi:hypothetical protein